MTNTEIEIEIGEMAVHINMIVPISILNLMDHYLLVKYPQTEERIKLKKWILILMMKMVMMMVRKILINLCGRIWVLPDSEVRRILKFPGMIFMGFGRRGRLSIDSI